jgi:hypothetical protein
VELFGDIRVISEVAKNNTLSHIHLNPDYIYYTREKLIYEIIIIYETLFLGSNNYFRQLTRRNSRYL